MHTLFHSLSASRREGSALVTTMIFITVMAIILEASYLYTSATATTSSRLGTFYQESDAADAAAEVVVGRLARWVTAYGGYAPSIEDCATAGIPGNANFPAITSAITMPASSALGKYTYSTPVVVPVLPDDTVITNTSDPLYLPSINDTRRLNVSENSPSSPTRYYYTRSRSKDAASVAARSISYRITITVTPRDSTRTSPKPYTIVRYLRCDKVSPFNWCTYRAGASNYANSNIYVGPMYIAGNIVLNGSSFTDSVLYGGSMTNISSTWLGAGISSQLKQTQLLSLFPNVTNVLATDSSGNRQASYETNTTASGGNPAPADEFSTRELIEPPTNPANDLTPAAIKDARIYNQADVRVKISVNPTNSAVTTSVVTETGTTVSAATNPWVTTLLSAFSTKPPASSTFYDRSRSTSTKVQVTDIDVGKLKTVMEANPTVFPNGIIYAWDDTGLSGGTRPLTGMRVWNAGVLPSGGLVLGTNDPVYLKGDFNTGTTLPANATVSTTTPVSQPPANTKSGSGATTASERVVSGYTVQPAGVFGDSITELTNAWQDSNSLNTSNGSSTTYNLVEGWSTMKANELRSDDTYTDMNSANPQWLENWGGKRRTMSGEEFINWHSRYGTTKSNPGGGWYGDITFDSRVTNLKLSWGTVNFVRERRARL